MHMKISNINIPAQGNRWQWLLVAVFVYFYWLMLKITLLYVPYSNSVAFLKIKQTEVASHPEYLYLFYAHVYTSIFVLLFGFMQFFKFKTETGRKIHRFAGYQYIVLLLGFAAPSGLYMGWHANGGAAAKVSFMLLSLLWGVTTVLAFVKIKKGQVAAHRGWMVRSFALTLSAVTLRLWKIVIVFLFHPPPMDVYKIIAWLGWIPNLIIAEIIIRNNK
ncbi:Predicted membrane protein [Flavobacterium akiainvivens]|nr:Predicted membrane protein [Flavobacterium akiainvivens]